MKITLFNTLVFFNLLINISLNAQLMNENWVLSNGRKINFKHKEVNFFKNEFDSNNFYKLCRLSSFTNGDNKVILLANSDSIINEDKKKIVDLNLLNTTNNGSIYQFESFPFESFVVKKPNSTKVLSFRVSTNYFFNNLNSSFPYAKLTCAEIDPYFNNNQGRLVNNKLLRNDCSGSFRVVKHQNNKDYWLLVANVLKHEIYSYLINENGVSNSPTNVFKLLDFNLNLTVQSDIKVSPNNQLVLLNVNYGNSINYGTPTNLLLLNFNNNIGAFSFQAKTNYKSSIYSFYTIDFSLNSKYVYCQIDSSNKSLAFINGLYALKINDIDTNISLFNKTLIGNFLTIELKNGLDNHMYLAKQNYQFDINNFDIYNRNLFILKYNNSPTKAYIKNFNYTDTLSSLLPQFRIFPNTIHTSYSFIIHPDTACQNFPIRFEANNGYADSFIWNFGDGSTQTFGESDSIYHSYSKSGKYNVFAIHIGDGNNDTIFSQIEIINAPLIQLGSDTLICQNKPLNLFADTLNYQTFLWSNNDTTSFITVNQSGLYHVKANNPYCASYDSVYVETVKCNYQVEKTCFKDTTTFTFEELNLDSIFLKQNNQTLKSNIHSEFQNTFTKKGQQDIQLKLYKNNLYATIDVPLKIDTIITPPIITDTLICRNTSYDVNLNANHYDSIRWSQANLSWNNTLTNEDEYIYTVYKNDCHYTDTINLYVIHCGIKTSGFCLGDSSFANLNETRLMDNIWTLENGTEINNNNNQISVKLNEGYYKNRVESRINNARLIQNFDFQVTEVPPIQFNADSLVCRFSKLNSGIDNPSILHYWQNNTSQFNEIRILESGKYHLMVQKEACIKRDSIELLVQDCECIIYYPDAFSPNSNQINEVFKPVTDCEASDYDITIFNKWGEIIYRNNDYLSGWNGKDSKNTDVMQDYYYYLVKYKSKLTGKILYKKGAVLLLR